MGRQKKENLLGLLTARLAKWGNSTLIKEMLQKNKIKIKIEGI